MFLVVVGVIQGIVFVASALNLTLRVCALPRVSRGANTSLSRPWLRNLSSLNLRDFACGLNLCGSALRLCWLADPHGTEGIYSPSLARGPLLRLPQLAWLASFGLVVLVYLFVSAAGASGDPHYRGAKHGIVLSLLVLMLACVPTSSLSAVNIGMPYTRLVADGTVGLYAIGLLLYALWVSFRARRFLDQSRRNAVLTDVQRDGVHQLVTNMAITVSMGCVLGFVLVISIIALLTSGVTPRSNRSAYLSIMFVVHSVCEGMLAMLILTANYTAKQQLCQSHWKCSWCKCKRRKVKRSILHIGNPDFVKPLLLGPGSTAGTADPESPPSSPSLLVNGGAINGRSGGGGVDGDGGYGVARSDDGGYDANGCDDGGIQMDGRIPVMGDCRPLAIDTELSDLTFTSEADIEDLSIAPMSSRHTRLPTPSWTSPPHLLLVPSSPGGRGLLPAPSPVTLRDRTITGLSLASTASPPRTPPRGNIHI